MKPLAKTNPLTLIRWVSLVAFLGCLLGSNSALAQDEFGEGTDLFPNFSLGGFGDSSDDEPIELSARYYGSDGGEGRIEVEATLAPTWHVYSTTQKPGGPTRTTLALTGPDGVEATGDFTPDRPPVKSVSEIYDGLTVEEFDGSVVWSAPIRMPAGFDDAITIDVKGLVCKSGGDNRCMPFGEELTAQYAGLAGASTVAFQAAGSKQSATLSEAEKSAAEKFRDGDYVVEWAAVVSQKKIAPGQTAILKFTAKPDPTFHVYKAVVDDSESSTNFVVTKKDGLLVGAPVANQPVVTKAILPTLPPVSYYKGEVTWQLPVKVPADATAGEKTIEGMIAYQACTDNSCHRPTALKFTAKLSVAEATELQPAPVQFASAKSAAALDAAAETRWVDTIALPDAVSSRENVPPDTDKTAAAAPRGPPSTDSSSDSESTTAFPLILGFAFLGGLILNVMPCVLPVVGLKIMGFVSQAGEDRGRILALNLVYVLGILSVFAIFAVVAAVSKFGWGEQFTYFPVRLGLTLLLFALALSYLGVWEIPVPGMAAGKASQELQSREGLAGAFSKGIFATILATPCSGPLLGYILGLTLNLSAVHTIAIFMTVGIGMASPYLMIGAQPKLVTWLPKPGPWMETLKQLMAFLFLGTVAFFFAQFNDTQKVPVFVSLIAVWFGCWIIGQVPNWAEFQKRVMAWTAGIAAATLISVWAFNYLKPDYKLAWEDYSEPRLQQLQLEGKTVMVDFGAKWCGTCIYNYEVAINTTTTRDVIDELDAVAMYADWTDYNEEIKSKLEELNSRSIPLLAIYPGDRPDQPIILRDLVTQEAVVEALRQAGASVGKTAKSRPPATVQNQSAAVALTNP